MPSSIQPRVLAARARRSRDELETRNSSGFAAIENGQYSRSQQVWGVMGGHRPRRGLPDTWPPRQPHLPPSKCISPLSRQGLYGRNSKPVDINTSSLQADCAGWEYGPDRWVGHHPTMSRIPRKEKRAWHSMRSVEHKWQMEHRFAARVARQWVAPHRLWRRVREGG